MEKSIVSGKGEQKMLGFIILFRVGNQDPNERITFGPKMNVVRE